MHLKMSSAKLWPFCLGLSVLMNNQNYNADVGGAMHDLHTYRKTSNIRHTLGNEIVDHSDVAGASPVGAAPTTSSFST